jgi:hypothetical protein
MVRKSPEKALALRMKNQLIFGGVAAILAALAGCAKPPPPPVVELPPPPVGHVYQTLVEMPPAPRYVRMTLAQKQQLQQAFNVIGLKSALMVGALSCGQQDEYDAFMTEYQPHVLDAQHQIDAYFRRIGGHYGQTKEDAFVTLLANNQTMGGIGQGQVFCLNNEAEFKTVMALKSDDQLDAFVTDNTPEGPVTPDAVAPPTTHHYIKKKVTHTTTVAQQ